MQRLERKRVRETGLVERIVRQRKRLHIGAIGQFYQFRVPVEIGRTLWFAGAILFEMQRAQAILGYQAATLATILIS